MPPWQFANVNRESPKELPTEFTIVVPPKTDVWRKPPKTDVFTAPILYQKRTVSTFDKARVVVTADWKTLHDHGGLIIVFLQDGDPVKWITSGITYVNSQATVATVATEKWADWSLMPLPHDHGQTVTVEMNRKGPSLFVHFVEGIEKTVIREVTWAFADENEEQEIWVGVYAARPNEVAEDEKKDLEVTFSHLIIE
ncbi:MAG: hypothetical protein M1819_004254 [Sarea resinae]|nr:MAG: hypothetical protein M1819_004254 [Sarea resinae]